MRLDELQAAFLTAKLKHLDRWNQERREISEHYDAAFGVCEGVELVPVLEGGESVRHLYVCRVKNRPELQAVLDTAGIGHLVHYPIPPHLQPACSSLGKRKGDYPVAEQWAEELISLPLWPGMKQEEIQHVATTVAGLYGKASC
jgi:dTDP-4-amino-4,6-dideoxygalactose transaminase